MNKMTNAAPPCRLARASLGLPLLLNLMAMGSVTYGTIYQKRYLQQGNLVAIGTLQYVGAFIVTLPVAYLIEPMRFDWTTQALAAMAWSEE